MFGLHGTLMPRTGRCWGVKSVIPGMGNGGTSSVHQPQIAPLRWGRTAAPEGDCRERSWEQLTAVNSLLSLNSTASAGARWEQQV